MKLGQRIVHNNQNSQGAYLTNLAENEDKLSSGETMDLIEDLRRLQKENPNVYISRKFYRQHGYYRDSAWDARFGTFHEFRRQSGLELSRGNHLLELHTAKHASVDIFRGFQELEVNPYVGKYQRPQQPGYRRIVVASDFHGDKCDPFALAVLVDTIERIKPDVVCLAGDIFDMFVFSRFDKDPRLCNLKKEFDFVKQGILKPIREAAGDGCQIDFVIGNHEHHLIRHLADKSPYMRVMMDLMGITLSQLLGLDEFKINLICRHDLAAFNAKDTKSETSKNYAVYYNTFTVAHDAPSGRGFKLCGASGHTHKGQITTDVDERGNDLWWMVLPGMAKPDMEYVDGLNKYQTGFGIVHIDTEHHSCVGELIQFNNHMACVGGKIYYRGCNGTK